MKILKRLTRSTKDAYWEAVEDCVVEFGGVPAPDARQLCIDRRAGVEFVPKSLRSDVYYHREPFDVGLDLAQGFHAGGLRIRPCLSDPQVAARYQLILQQHGLA